MVWGSTNCNYKCVALLEFLNSWNLEILNHGRDFTYSSAGRLEVIYITLGYCGLLEHFKTWEVSSELSVSDHRHNRFTVVVSVLVHLIRNHRSTIWESFREGLKVVLVRGPEVNMKDEAGLGFAILSVQQVLISACENNCLLKPAGEGKHTLNGHMCSSCCGELVRRGRVVD